MINTGTRYINKLQAYFINTLGKKMINNFIKGKERVRLQRMLKLHLTSPKAPLPTTFNESKSSFPILDRFSLKNSVSFLARRFLDSCF